MELKAIKVETDVVNIITTVHATSYVALVIIELQKLLKKKEKKKGRNATTSGNQRKRNSCKGILIATLIGTVSIPEHSQLRGMQVCVT